MSDLPIFEKNVFSYPAGFQPRDWARESLNKLIEGVEAELPRIQRRESSTPFSFINYAATGAGKTYYAAMVAATLLNKGIVTKVVFICPNKLIDAEVRSRFDEFNIKLVEWDNYRHKNGIPGDFDGAVMTYQSLLESYAAWANRSLRDRFLVIFDEIHHLGERRRWGNAARDAFQVPSNIILGLTGTPFREDRRRIPFTEFHEEQPHLFVLKTDYDYPLGKAVADKVCRYPYFRWLDAAAQLDGRTVVLDQAASEKEANRVLAEAVCPGTPSRLDMLRQSIANLDYHKVEKVIIFVGGDPGSAIETKPTYDVEEVLPKELMSLGVPADQIEFVTGKSPNARKKIQDFNTNSKRFLLTVNMVSEGVDIPNLRAAIFLTVITAKSTTIQRIGRVLRGDGIAWIYMPKHPTYLELAAEIYKKIKREICLRNLSEEDVLRRGKGSERAIRLGSGLKAWLDGFTVAGQYFSKEMCDEAREEIKSLSLPVTDEMVAAWLLRRSHA